MAQKYFSKILMKHKERRSIRGLVEYEGSVLGVDYILSLILSYSEWENYHQPKE